MRYSNSYTTATTEYTIKVLNTVIKDSKLIFRTDFQRKNIWGKKNAYDHCPTKV